MFQVPTERPQYLRVAVFGQPGAGKTTFCATWPDPVWIDTDRGLLPVLHTNPRAAQPNTLQDLEKVVGTARAEAEAGSAKTVIVDSLSEVHRLVLTSLIVPAPSKAVRPGLESILPDRAEYGAAQAVVERLLTELKRIPAHIVVTCDLVVRDGIRQLGLPPGTQQVLHRWADVVGEILVAEDGSRAFVTAPHLTRWAKSRIKLPPAVPPNASQLLTTLYIERKEAPPDVIAAMRQK